MSKNSNLTIYDAISVLKRIYESAVKREYIHKPISYALYECWREFDKREKSR